MTPRVFVRGPASAQQRRTVIRAALAALADQSVAGGQTAVALVDRERMLELNHQFAGVDRPTDVLSFPDGSTDPQSGQAYLGDIAICAPIAQEQADAAGHSLDAELSLLTVHGVLHLLGHDHADPAEKERMWLAQQRILRQLGIADRTRA